MSILGFRSRVFEPALGDHGEDGLHGEGTVPQSCSTHVRAWAGTGGHTGKQAFKRCRCRFPVRSQVFTACPAQQLPFRHSSVPESWGGKYSFASMTIDGCQHLAGALGGPPTNPPSKAAIMPCPNLGTDLPGGFAVASMVISSRVEGRWDPVQSSCTSM